MSKCNSCGQEMTWKGSMMDGGLSCDCSTKSISKNERIFDIKTKPYDVPTKIVEVMTKNTITYYLLVGQAIDDYDDFKAQFDHGCQCATSHAPCSWCVHPGNPNGFDNRNDAVAYP